MSLLILTRRMFKRDSFARGALTLMTGTTLAQAIPIAISPIVTRLFTPADYGVFALYGALVAFFAVVSTGRYELAVTLPESEEDADALVVLSAIVSAGFGLLLLLALAPSHRWVARALGHPEIGPWLFLVPLSVTIVGVYNALNYWLNRGKHYRRMSNNRILQAGASSGLQLSMGAAGLGASGLVLGQFIGVAVATGQLASVFWRHVRQQELGSLRARLKPLARRYLNHPKHLLPAHGVGAAALQLPVLGISMLFGASAAGFYALAFRIMTLPTTLVANALGDVYRQRAAEMYRSQGEFRRLFLITLGASAGMAIVPVMFVFVIAPDLFAFVFGEPWRVAGEYARILSIAAFFQFAFTPTDKGALVVGATRYIVVWHVIRLISFVGALCLGWGLSLSIEATLIIFVAANISVYVLDGVVEYVLAGGRGSIRTGINDQKSLR